jgi:Family of unknown function (DUF6283)
MAKRRQCAKCPWKISTNPWEIPNGYSAEQHRALTCTIAKRPVGEATLDGDLHLMACHESPVGREVPCVGWLDNQLGPGNNLLLRYAVILGRVSTDYELDGEQHESLEATFPDDA